MPQAPELASQLRDVRVGVRPELEVSRHVFGGDPAYVVTDPVSFQSHRLSSEDYQVFAALSDRQTLGAVFKHLTETHVLEEDQEELFYQFVLSLTQRGLLNLPLSDGGRLFKRYEDRKAAKRKGRLMSALFLRIPLINPDRLLDRTMGLVRPMFSYGAVLVWVVGLVVSLMIVWSRWDEVTSPLASILAVGNIPVLWTLLVGLKVIHEFGHAYACKRFGGVVPEMGAYLIMLTPCAYVDASSSWGFTSRWQRIVVALAGMYFESFAAMAALLLWVITPPGTLHDAAHYAVVLSTIVTIGFNANPLMRYDGYYILSDAVAIPNLRAEADGRVRQVFKRLLFGVKTEWPEEPTGRRIGLFVFGLASALYKVTLVFGISFLIATKLPLVGFGLALMYVFQSLRRSIGGLINYLRFSEELIDRRRRATLVTAGGVLGLAMLSTNVSMPGGVNTVAVVAPLDEWTVRAETPGFVQLVSVSSGDLVGGGTELCRLRNLDVESEMERLQAEAEGLEIAWKRAALSDPQNATEIKTKLSQLKQDLYIAQQRRDALRVCTTHQGVVTTIHAEHEGEFVRKGDPVVTIGAGQWTLRALLTAEQVVHAKIEVGELVRYRLTGCPGATLNGKVLQVASQGQAKVEHTELTQLAGGTITVDPTSSESTEPLFEVTIGIADPVSQGVQAGGTAVLSFSSQRVTLLDYLYRRGLQLVQDLRVTT